MNKQIKILLKKAKLNESSVSLALGILVVLIIGLILARFLNRSSISLAPGNSQTTASENESSETGENGVKSGEATKHTVQAGESLWSIAEKYYQSGYKWVDIAKENQLDNPGKIVSGQVLKIPAAATIQSEKSVSNSIEGDKYTVVKGDNLWDIAVRTYGDGFQWSKIAQANNLVHPNLIHPGNELVLPR